MNSVATWVMVVIWFLHLAIAAGAGYAVIRLWPYRRNTLIRHMATYMFAAPITALTSIVMTFMAKGITLNWKFAVTWFAGTFLADVVRVPFILYLLKGSSGREMLTEDRTDP